MKDKFQYSNETRSLIFIIFFIAFALASCSYSTKTTYRLVPEEEYVKDCGYSILCEHYVNQFAPEGEIAVTVTIDTLGEIKCDKKLVPKSVTVRFSNSPDTLHLYETLNDSIHKICEYHFNSKDFKKEFKENKSIEVKILFFNVENEKTFILNKHEELIKVYWKFFC